MYLGDSGYYVAEILHPLVKELHVYYCQSGLPQSAMFSIIWNTFTMSLFIVLPSIWATEREIAVNG